MPEIKQGWWNPTPYNTRGKFHFIGADGRTLCGKWGYTGQGFVEDGQDEHADNCAACKRKRRAARGQEKKDE